MLSGHNIIIVMVVSMAESLYCVIFQIMCLQLYNTQFVSAEEEG